MARPATPPALLALLSLLALVAAVPPADAFTCYQHPIQVTNCNVGAPLALTGEPREDGVHLSWTAPVYGEVDGYTVHRRAASMEDWADIDVGLSQDYLDTPPRPGVYVYYVSSYRGEGEEKEESPPSNPVATMWPYCLPASVDPWAAEKFTYNIGCVYPLPVSAPVRL